MANPILWAHHAKSQREVRRNVGGKIVVEKIPQRGHVGNSDYDKPEIQRGQRWAHVVDHAGNAVRVPLTTGASLFIDAVEDQGYEKYQRAKFRGLGWYDVGRCPCAMLANGELQASHFASPEVAASEACRPGTYKESAPCPHSVAEMRARQAQQKIVQAEKDERFKPEAEKILAGQREQTKEIASSIADTMAGAVREIVKALPQAAAPEPQEKVKK